MESRDGAKRCAILDTYKYAQFIYIPNLKKMLKTNKDIEITLQKSEKVFNYIENIPEFIIVLPFTRAL